MDRPSRSKTPAAGGFLIAVGLTVGAILGMTRGNALLWLLIGALAGVAAAVAIWLIDRRR
jgi:UDP-N-acetylmuramyl pentapeptide phosphotransferase/UDP-N-acetylglucosamine-1-phosphate transferase